jgi:hypothetical protein
VSDFKGKMAKCSICGARIWPIDGEYHHVWWKKVDGQFVPHGSRYCVWVGEPAMTLQVATPAEGVGGGGSGQSVPVGSSPATSPSCSSLGVTP